MMPLNPAHLSNEQDPIIARCTPHGSGAIAIIRLSGNCVDALVDNFARTSSHKKLVTSDTHTIHHGHVIGTDNEIIDEVLFFLMRAPKTFTGQDTIEISCHNNPFIVEKIISCALKHGARIAKPGEFTQRAFLNGKIDLLQAESINDVIHAQTELALNTSLRQLKGSLSDYFGQLEKSVITLLSLVESSFEFLDEEQQDLALDKRIHKTTGELISYITKLKKQFNLQQQIKQGIRIALIGSVNTGKSTLFNALLKKERAIVTNTPGTTRDSIEYSIYKSGVFWSIIDTAGIRTTTNTIEQEGINRSLREAKTADIILLVLDASQTLSFEEKTFYKSIYDEHDKKTIIVVNKIDKKLAFDPKNLFSLKDPKYEKISAQNNIGLDTLENIIDEKIKELFSQLQSPFLLNKRQYNLITTIEQRLQSIAKNCSNNVNYELIAYHLKDMLEKTSELTGKTINEKMLDTVFSTFCVGK